MKSKLLKIFVVYAVLAFCLYAAVVFNLYRPGIIPFLIKVACTVLGIIAAFISADILISTMHTNNRTGHSISVNVDESEIKVDHLVYYNNDGKSAAVNFKYIINIVYNIVYCDYIYLIPNMSNPDDKHTFYSYESGYDNTDNKLFTTFNEYFESKEFDDAAKPCLGKLSNVEFDVRCPFDYELNNTKVIL